MLCGGASATPLWTCRRVFYSWVPSQTNEPSPQAESGAGLPGRALRLVVARRAATLAAAARAGRRPALRPSSVSAAPDGVASERGRDRQSGEGSRCGGPGARGAAAAIRSLDLGRSAAVEHGASRRAGGGAAAG